MINSPSPAVVPAETAPAVEPAETATDAPRKRPWSKPTVKVSDDVLLVSSGPGSHALTYDTSLYFPVS